VPFEERNAFDQGNLLSSAVRFDGATIRCASGIPPLLAQKDPCDPETPVLEAQAGETVRLHFVHGGGHTRQQGLSVSGHSWNPYPWSDDSHVFDASAGSSIRQGVFNGFGPMMGISLELKAGGADKVPLDYLMRSQASFLFDGGIWGIFRVRPVESAQQQ
jgi:manganese oxidase